MADVLTQLRERRDRAQARSHLKLKAGDRIGAAVDSGRSAAYADALAVVSAGPDVEDHARAGAICLQVHCPSCRRVVNIWLSEGKIRDLLKRFGEQ